MGFFRGGFNPHKWCARSSPSLTGALPPAPPQIPPAHVEARAPARAPPPPPPPRRPHPPPHTRPLRCCQVSGVSLGGGTAAADGGGGLRSKTHLRLAIGRIRLLRNKKQVGMQGLRREIAELLATGKEDSARIRVESVHREENLLIAFELLELFCELLSVRIALIVQERAVPDDMREALSSAIYAAQRLPEIPELITVRGCLAQKYGKEFAMQCNSPVTCEEKGVSPRFINALSVAAPSGRDKFDLLVGIAAEFGVAWDADEAAVRIMGTHQSMGAPPDPEDIDYLANELVAAAQDAVRLEPLSADDKAEPHAVEESFDVDALTSALARQGGQGNAPARVAAGKAAYNSAAEAAEAAEAAAKVAKEAAILAAEMARQEAAAAAWGVGKGAGSGSGASSAKSATAEDSKSIDDLSKRFEALKKR